MKPLLVIVAALWWLLLPADAQVLPARLPDPDGEPGTATKPVKEYRPSSSA